jgi:2,3-bisphosphoglycerate-dependent phosphoglycerate mutase
MKIYILRHEERTIDCSFFGPLTMNGLQNSKKLINKLDMLNITDVYSSPFIRTLQTIEPFIKKNNMKIKLEYSLTVILKLIFLYN